MTPQAARGRVLDEAERDEAAPSGVGPPLREALLLPRGEKEEEEEEHPSRTCA